MNEPMALVFVILCGVTVLFMMWALNHLRDRISRLEEKFEGLVAHGLSHRHVVYNLDTGKVLGETDIGLKGREVHHDFDH